jgi:hypothetical protein
VRGLRKEERKREMEGRRTGLYRVRMAMEDGS